MSLQVDVKKTLGQFSLEVAFQTDGKWHGILGASGCGKSMTLKMIAGIITPDEGRIALGDQVFFDSALGINLSPQERKVGFLFQNYALFPNMTVEKNIACGLGGGVGSKVREMMERLQLNGLEKRYPSQLSGGQQQRVALARCLAYEPCIIMLDEPFSALDEYLKERLQQEVKRVLTGYQGEVILVSHNRDEVYRFCEKIVILHEGSVVVQGNTREVFSCPKHVTAARLSGCKNISPAKKIGENSVYALNWGVALETAGPVGEDIRYVGIRAHDISLDPAGTNEAKGKIKEIHGDLFETNVIFSTGEGDLWWKISKNDYEEARWGIEAPESLYLPPEKLLLLTGGKYEED